MPPFLMGLGLKDYVIAGLSALLILLVANTYLDVSLGPLHFEGWKPKAERLERERNIVIAAQKLAAEKQKAVNDAKQKDYDNAAEDSEDTKPLIDAAVDAAVAEYARTHRVRAGGSCPSSGTVTPAESGNPGVAESVPADSGVFVSDATLQALSGASSYAVACHNWAISVAD